MILITNGLSKNALYGAEVWGCGWQLGPVENMQMRAALTYGQTHAHTLHYGTHNDSVTHIRLHLYVSTQCLRRITSIFGKLQTSRWMFGLLALISAVQPSKTRTRLLNPIYHSPTPTGLCNLISLDCLAMPTPYPHMHAHTSMAILHPWLTTPIYTTTHAHTRTHTHISTRSQHYAATVSHMPTQHVLHTDAHVPSYTDSTLMWQLVHKHSTTAHTQNMNTCLCWCTHTHTHTSKAKSTGKANC